MCMKNLILAALTFASIGMVSAQNMNGDIIGKVLDSTDLQPIIGARVWVEVGDSKLYSVTNVDGRFRISAVPPGTYSLYIKNSKDTMIVHNQYVKPDGICAVPDVYFSSYVMKDETEIIGRHPMIDQGNEHMITMLPEDIALSVNRLDVASMIENMSSDISRTGNGDFVIRGSRPGDVIFFVDGVKSDNLNRFPGSAIGGVTVYTGGIPAKYGDTTGGVIILETKSYFDMYREWKIAMGRK
jgi:hypothetical protein